ncbi:MAG: PBSX family phage terminase large subunit, partial [Bacillota bacterium]|nr:PBSX family phage terminase large subunit [Bacillota bacterium]
GKKISHIKWVDDDDGYIQIHEYPDKRVRYALGGDTAGEGEDYFTALVGSSKTGRTVAKLKKQFDADEYTRQIYCLGMYYNYALIGVEVNFDPSVVKDLTRLGYRNQYIREVQDSISEKYKKAYGFKTTAYTRPIILNRLIEIVKFNVEILLDRDLLEEMLTFVRNEKGRMEAMNGAHDDLVMGAGILYETLTQVPATPIEVVEKAKKKRRVDYDDEDEDIDNDDEDKFLNYEG